MKIKNKIMTGVIGVIALITSTFVGTNAYANPAEDSIMSQTKDRDYPYSREEVKAHAWNAIFYAYGESTNKDFSKVNIASEELKAIEQELPVYIETEEQATESLSKYFTIYERAVLDRIQEYAKNEEAVTCNDYKWENDNNENYSTSKNIERCYEDFGESYKDLYQCYAKLAKAVNTREYLYANRDEYKIFNLGKDNEALVMPETRYCLEYKNWKTVYNLKLFYANKGEYEIYNKGEENEYVIIRDSNK